MYSTTRSIGKQVYSSLSLVDRLAISSIAKKSSRYVSVFCRESTFVFVLNYRLTTGTKKTGKKARSLARSIGKQLYSSVSLVDRLAITSCLQSPSIVADMSAFSVRLDIYVCTTLLANNREEENRDGRPSHFLSFSYCFKLQLLFLSCLLAAYDLL